jgi:hypothetical protein
MRGRYYGVYDLKREDECVGVFESTDELCAFFGGIKRYRVWCAISRKNPLAFKTKRYWVEPFEEPTKTAVRRVMKQKFGLWMYKIVPEGIFVRANRADEWHYFAGDFEEALSLCAN